MGILMGAGLTEVVLSNMSQSVTVIVRLRFDGVRLSCLIVNG